MSNSNKFKNVFDRSAWADKKFKSFKRIEKNYDRLFALDFYYEIQFANSKASPLIEKKPKQETEEESSKTIDVESYKKIYRNLARLTHPDAPYGETEEFKKIRQAYVDGDVSTLLREAVDKGLNPEINPEDIEAINESTDKKLRSMREARQAWHFRWAHSKKCLKERKKMWSLLSIDSSEFKAFLVSNSVDLRDYHEKSASRWKIYNEGEQ